MKAKPRVLLLSATSGAGHVRAAQALEKAFLACGDCVVEHIDALQYVSRLFRRVYDKAYIAMVRRAPELMGLLYERTDQPWRHPRRRLALDRLNTGPMIRLLKRIQPDLCVATHFLPAEIIAWLIAKRKLRAHNAIVVTDYDVHAMWLAARWTAITWPSMKPRNTWRASACHEKSCALPAYRLIPCSRRP